MRRHRMLVPAAALPVTIPELKDWAGIGRDDVDDQLTRALRVAVDWVEARTHYAQMVRTYELTYDSFGARKLSLLWSPYGSLVSFESRATPTASYSTVSPTLYLVDIREGAPSALILRTGATWPTVSEYAVDAVRIRYTAGHASASLVPDSLKQAVLIVAAAVYDRRPLDDLELARTVDPFTRPYRLMEVM